MLKMVKMVNSLFIFILPQFFEFKNFQENKDPSLVLSTPRMFKITSNQCLTAFLEIILTSCKG